MIQAHSGVQIIFFWNGCTRIRPTSPLGPIWSKYMINQKLFWNRSERKWLFFFFKVDNSTSDQGSAHLNFFFDRDRIGHLKIFWDRIGHLKFVLDRIGRLKLFLAQKKLDRIESELDWFSCKVDFRTLLTSKIVFYVFLF